ncbi:hypothetical protein CBR_g6400 [Chara braunii]|uniref:RCC1-like domain-containing protein n=1 Tax=Chara braunii TaxID=69332 RepID=A0A388KJP1_CHABU|nr:hypothetical protein CBR_g6400 [Chara braunii]|eukprot:GBG70272.1 hypothetical protein CBR_g6400 [Chara braunii]
MVDRYAMVPVALPGHVRVTQVAAGKAFSLAVTEDGRVWSWGCNVKGELGLGDTVARLLPEMVEGKLAEETVEAVSAGFEHVVALTKQGVLYVWGSNDRGQLGTGEDAAYHMVPTQIGGSVFGIKFAHIAAGLKHCIVASKSGEVYAWGANDFGQLGLGDVEDRKNPAAILSKFTRSRISRVR